MDDRFSEIASDSELARDAAEELHDIGFTVIAGPEIYLNFRRSSEPTMPLCRAPIPLTCRLAAQRLACTTSSIAALTSMGSTSLGQSWGRVVASSVNLSS